VVVQFKPEIQEEEQKQLKGQYFEIKEEQTWVLRVSRLY
jgi:hypothetical protein